MDSDASSSILRDDKLTITIVHVKPFNFFCFSATDVIKLRKSHKILGQLVGHLPAENLAPKALSTQGLPLLLSPYEVYIGFKCVFISLVINVAQETQNTPSNNERRLEKQVTILTQRKSDDHYKYAHVDAAKLFSDYFCDPIFGKKRFLIAQTFEHFWSFGYFVQTSSPFQTDLVVYTADPILVHASYLVICIPRGQKLKLRDLMTYARLASSVNKTLLIASNKFKLEMADDTLTDVQNEATKKSHSHDSSAPSNGSESPSTVPLEYMNTIQDSVELFEFTWAGVS